MKKQNWGIYSGHPKRKAFAVVGSLLWLFLIILGVGGGFERAMAAEMPTIQGVSPVTGVEGQTITLQAGVYDPDSTPPFEYLWRFPDGSTSTNETPSLQLVDSGNVFVQVIVKDKDGQSSMPYLQLIVVSNVPTTVLSLGPLTGGEGQTLQLASVLKNAGRPYLRRYEWTLPDGSKSDEASPSWHFQQPGTYPLSLRVSKMKLEPIYNNTRDYGDSPTYYPGHEENGDEVFFGGTNRFLQRFGFMYYGEFGGMSEADLAKAKARIRFYKNDGPNMPDTLNTETPKTLIFESQPFSLYAGYNWKEFDELQLFVPDRLTWTVEYIDVPQTYNKRAGLVFYNSTEKNGLDLGSSFDDFWMNPDTGWALYQFGGHPIANFGAFGMVVSDQIETQSELFRAEVVITNVPPQILGANIPSSGLVNAPLTFTALAQDAGNGQLSYAWNFGDGTSASGTNVAHAFAAEGSYPVILTVQDAFNSSVSLTNQVIVNADRKALRFTSVPVLSVNQDENYRYEVATITPGDGQILHIILTNAPDWLTWTDQGNGTGLFTGDPDNSQVGSYPMAIELTDGVTQEWQTFTLTVLNVNDAPTISSISNQAILMDSELGPLSFLIGDIDPGQINLTLTAQSSNPVLISPESIWLNGEGSQHSISLKPNTNSVGTATISIRVSDGELTSQTSFDVTVSRPLMHRLSFAATVGGKIEAQPAGLEYRSGDVVRITAIPNAGFTFSAWSAGVSGTDNPLLITMDRDYTVGASFQDAMPPVITVQTPVNGPVTTEVIELTGTITDNQKVASARWDRSGGTGGVLALDAQGNFKVIGLRLNRGINQFTVTAQDSAGNESQSLVAVQWAPGLLFTVLDAAEQREGKKVVFPIKFASAGEVGGMSFDIRYNPDYLQDPQLSWSSETGLAMTQVNTNTPGVLSANFALPGTTLTVGSVEIGRLEFRTRSVPFALTTEIEPEIVDISDALGQPITTGYDAFLGTVRIVPRRYKGDNNANDRLDIGDATLLQRMIAALNPQRSWDLSLNDLNGNNQLDSGDVVRILRVVTGLDLQPGKLGLLNQAQIGEPTDYLEDPRVFASTSRKSLLTAQQPNFLLYPPVLSGKAGQKITVEIRLQNLPDTLAGASFRLRYPPDALKLADTTAYVKGAIVPSEAVVVWNLNEAQGTINMAASSPNKWSTANGVLATLTFTVLQGLGSGTDWPLILEAQEISQNGYDNRLFGSQAAGFAAAQFVRPQIASFQPLPNNQVELKLIADEGLTFTIEASHDMRVWEPLATFKSGAVPIRFNDPKAGDFNNRFYRVKTVVPAGTLPPAVPVVGR